MGGELGGQCSIQYDNWFLLVCVNPCNYYYEKKTKFAWPFIYGILNVIQFGGTA
jgi:hypothetical protein